MESPNAEYRGSFDPAVVAAAAAATTPTRSELEQLSDQYKSMRELLKIYGLNVAEGLVPDNVDKAHKPNGEGKKRLFIRSLIIWRNIYKKTGGNHPLNLAMYS